VISCVCASQQGLVVAVWFAGRLQAVDVPDLTPYGIETLARARAETVRHARGDDVAAWRSATAT